MVSLADAPKATSTNGVAFKKEEEKPATFLANAATTNEVFNAFSDKGESQSLCII